MKIHFLGIGGSGASAIAAIALATGYEVNGCDKEPFNEFTQNFDKAILLKGHSPKHIQDIELLVITPAILSLDPNNPELEEAKKQKIPVITWHEFMGKFLMKDKFVIAIAGTHGKSTTTAMIAQVLEDAGLDPTVELGAIVPKWGTNYRVGKSKYFVTEADEFNDNYLYTKPDIAVVTNIEMDHPEYFAGFENYKDSFRKFLSQTKLKIYANLSSRGVVETLETDKAAKSFKFPPMIDYSQSLKLNLPLKVLGEFNKQNAFAAFQVGLTLGLDSITLRNSLMQFSGIGRRMEFLGKYKGADIYCDFGHHPTEIKVTIDAFRKKYPEKRLLVVFQPHMFSRTKALFNDFVKVFQTMDADQVFLVDIYPSREVDKGEVNSKQLVAAISKPNVSYLPDRQAGIGSIKQTEEFIKVAIRKGDLVIFLGAGDIDQVGRKIVKE